MLNSSWRSSQRLDIAMSSRVPRPRDGIRHPSPRGPSVRAGLALALRMTPLDALSPPGSCLQDLFHFGWCGLHELWNRRHDMKPHAAHGPHRYPLFVTAVAAVVLLFC